jgi:DNA-binding MarR family transcriptional regulator
MDIAEEGTGMAEKRERRDLPIGYWLKHVDELITARAAEVLEDEGLSRFHWQVLNILSERGGASWDEVFSILRTFVDREGLDRILDGLAARGWLERRADAGEGPELRLSSAGVDAHRRIAERIAAMRRRVVEGISQDDYALVVRTLQRMAANLA